MHADLSAKARARARAGAGARARARAAAPAKALLAAPRNSKRNSCCAVFNQASRSSGVCMSCACEAYQCFPVVQAGGRELGRQSRSERKSRSNFEQDSRILRGSASNAVERNRAACGMEAGVCMDGLHFWGVLSCVDSIVEMWTDSLVPLACRMLRPHPGPHAPHGLLTIHIVVLCMLTRSAQECLMHSCAMSSIMLLPSCCMQQLLACCHLQG